MYKFFLYIILLFTIFIVSVTHAEVLSVREIIIKTNVDDIKVSETLSTASSAEIKKSKSFRYDPDKGKCKIIINYTEKENKKGTLFFRVTKEDKFYDLKSYEVNRSNITEPKQLSAIVKMWIMEVTKQVPQTKEVLLPAEEEVIAGDDEVAREFEEFEKDVEEAKIKEDDHFKVIILPYNYNINLKMLYVFEDPGVYRDTVDIENEMNINSVRFGLSYDTVLSEQTNLLFEGYVIQLGFDQKMKYSLNNGPVQSFSDKEGLSELVLKNAYLQFDPEETRRIKVGFINQNWGVIPCGSVLDVLNPDDNFLFTELSFNRDMKKNAVLGVLFSQSIGRSKFEATLYPGYQISEGEKDLNRLLFGYDPTSYEDSEESIIGARFTGSTDIFDYSLLYYNGIHYNPVHDDIVDGSYEERYVFPKREMYGFSIQLPQEQFNLQFELGHFPKETVPYEVYYDTVYDVSYLSYEHLPTTKMMLGVDIDFIEDSFIHVYLSKIDYDYDSLDIDLDEPNEDPDFYVLWESKEFPLIGEKTKIFVGRTENTYFSNLWDKVYDTGIIVSTIFDKEENFSGLVALTETTFEELPEYTEEMSATSLYLSLIVLF